MPNDKQCLQWLSNKLETLSESGFRQSALYKVLRDGLTARDHWKQQRRGKPNLDNFIQQPNSRQTAKQYTTIND